MGWPWVIISFNLLSFVAVGYLIVIVTSVLLHCQNPMSNAIHTGTIMVCPKNNCSFTG